MLTGSAALDISPFFKRLQDRREEVHRDGVPRKLNRLINQKDLLEIYDYLLTNKPRIIQHLAVQTPNQQPRLTCRIDKHDSGLARTLNITHTGSQLMLMLETKSKLRSGAKDPDTFKVRGRFKRGKVAWRIDKPNRRPWLNMVIRPYQTFMPHHPDDSSSASEDSPQSVVIRGGTPESSRSQPDSLVKRRAIEACIDDLSDEIKKSQYLAAQSKTQYRKPLFFSQYYPGSFYKKGEEAKVNVYTLQKSGSLVDFLNAHHPSSDDIDNILISILLALKIMHEQGLVYQDLKRQNVLFEMKGNDLNISLTDFDLVCSTRSTNKSVATYLYESPEISYRAHPSLNQQLATLGESAGNISYYSGYYHHPKSPYGISLGRSICQRLMDVGDFPSDEAEQQLLCREYMRPHKANDVWALGILAYELKHGVIPNELTKEVLGNIKNDPFLASCLIQREQRATVDELLEHFTEEKIAEVIEINRQKPKRRSQTV